MKQVYIIKENGNHGLVLMFGGWGSGPELFAGYAVPEGYDFLLCHDYRDMDFDFSMLAGYADVRLVAWSMGVWAAEAVLGNADAALGSRIAVGGTPYPIDDVKGIPVDIFAGTLENMSEATLAKFRRRMCGAALGHFMEHVPGRGADELKEELRCLRENVMAAPCVGPGFGWDLAIAGTSDMIFPPQNQKNAWESLSVKVCMAECARHYDPSIFRLVLSSLSADMLQGMILDGAGGTDSGK